MRVCSFWDFNLFIGIKYISVDFNTETLNIIIEVTCSSFRKVKMK